MATTKAITAVLFDDVALTAGAGDQTATAANVTDAYRQGVVIKLTNGGTGPTVAAQVQVEVSLDNSNWYEHGGPVVGGTANSGIYSQTVIIPDWIQYVRAVAGSNTGQNVTCRAEVGEVSAV
jgi:hypothetical protein